MPNCNTDDQKCVHLPPNSGQTSVNFDIHLGKCGMTSSDAMGAGSGAQTGLQQQLANGQQQPNGLYIENTIIIQYDPLVQEIYDQARKLRCTWYDYYEKSVTFRPYNVDMLDAVTANFLGDNIQCWMQIQVGKGPWSSEVAGIVKIGQTMTMVLAIKDDENRFDMLVRNCVAHDGKHQPIQLVDEYGCVARPKIMAKFQKVRNFGPSATVVSYAHFQAFKFPDSMSVHFQCIIQVCRYECPEPVCNQGAGAGSLSELGGGSSTGPQQTAPGDYATSGTEMVASKELPLSAPGPFGPANHSLYHQHQQQAGGSSNNVLNLKLDESQGRVQVKLDTSMMAGLGGRGAQPAPGPLPPHLLHVAGGGGQTGELRAGGSGIAGAPYYRPAAPGGAPKSAFGGGAGGRQQQLVAPPGGGQTHQQQQVHYSPAYGSVRRSAATFASRLGEQAPDVQRDQLAALPPPSNHQLPGAPYDTEHHPLSLIAAPRGLRMGSPVSADDQVSALFGLGSAARFKRHAHEPSDQARRTENVSAGRQLRSADSTSVQTQKTIQVVSPDDVAFSLVEDQEESVISAAPFGAAAGARAQRKQQPLGGQDSVCFSTTRLLLGLMVSLGALASCVVIVAFVILRQRSQLGEKLSAVYDPNALAQTLDAYGQAGGHQAAGSGPAVAAAQRQQAELLARQRQRDAIQQRNNYLARLYSQFAPATYWR